jgi:hypothetical protein
VRFTVPDDEKSGMLRPHIFACLVLAGALFETAQTPAPSVPPSPAPSGSAAPEGPLRHLQYGFTVDEEGISEYQFSPISANGDATGVGGSVSSDGGSGTMSIDVLSIAPDGALLVRISEFVDGELRARQAYTCTVYGSTAVLCPSVPAPSQAEWILLSYLGRQFVDAAPWDAQHHWQRSKETPQYSLVEDFTMGDSADPKKIVINESKKMKLHNGGFGSQTEDIVIVYDRAMEVPLAVSDDMRDVEGSSSGHGTFKFALEKDSFSTPSP